MIRKSDVIDVPFREHPADNRCHYHTRTGRCTMLVSDPLSSYCSVHARPRMKQHHSDSGDLSAELLDGLDNFNSAIPINDFLSRLLRLQAQGRIPPRRAAVMAFNCNLLLHTLPAIARENQPDKNAPLTIVWDIPVDRRRYMPREDPQNPEGVSEASSTPRPEQANANAQPQHAKKQKTTDPSPGETTDPPPRAFYG